MAGKKGMTGNGLGGKRSGAGRPRLGSELAVHISVTVSSELAAVAYTLGDGNYSAGVRTALRMIADGRLVVSAAEPQTQE